MDTELHKLYYDPKIGFTNINSFYNKVKEKGFKYSRKEVNEWYKKQSINQIFSQIKPKIRSSIISFKSGECLQADLLDISKFKFKKT